MADPRARTAQVWMLSPRHGLIWWLDRASSWGVLVGRDATTLRLGRLVLNVRYVRRSASSVTVMGRVDG